MDNKNPQVSWSTDVPIQEQIQGKSKKEMSKLEAEAKKMRKEERRMLRSEKKSHLARQVVIGIICLAILLGVIWVITYVILSNQKEEVPTTIEYLQSSCEGSGGQVNDIFEESSGTFLVSRNEALKRCQMTGITGGNRLILPPGVNLVLSALSLPGGAVWMIGTERLGVPAILYRQGQDRATWSTDILPYQLRNPLRMTTNARGDILVLDLGKPNRVHIIKPSNPPTGYSFNLPSSWVEPSDIVTFPTGEIAISYYYDNCVRLLAPNGTPLKVTAGICKSSGTFNSNQLYHPLGLAVDKLNHLLVSDFENARIGIFSSSGDYLQSLDIYPDKPRDVFVTKKGELVIGFSSGIKLYEYTIPK